MQAGQCSATCVRFHLNIRLGDGCNPVRVDELMYAIIVNGNGVTIVGYHPERAESFETQFGLVQVLISYKHEVISRKIPVA